MLTVSRVHAHPSYRASSHSPSTEVSPLTSPVPKRQFSAAFKPLAVGGSSAYSQLLSACQIEMEHE